MTSALPSGRDSGEHAVRRDAELAGDRPGGALVVPGQQDGTQAQAAQARDGGGRAGPQLVGDHQRGAGLPVPAGQDRGAAVVSAAASTACAQPGGHLEGQLGEQRGAARR